ncbi:MULTISPECIES: ArpU family phage packaging/lysis transcriptional regulator [Paenibacillus]|uniref:ArpU family phage packaging/lysis transcriptional regulator n=1 Tax=Paenibacillus TaxID=44249 RepID=UPI001F3C8237|nr:ArpU family phage packaging/lysis transcriptional regulator [Paenibacillus sp. JJ-223]CAH1203943.1 hypothetical protein PAECIP111890_02419 [Paenibacillus sp. JJ-223]
MEMTLPELDRRKTQAAVEAALEKYRIYKTVAFEEREAMVTASYTARFHGATNVTGDSTARTAIHNVDVRRARQAYCDTIETIVSRLSEKEQILVTERYMKDDDVFDYKVYNHVFDPPVSKDTYTKIRTRAFYKMALALADRGLINMDPLASSRTERKKLG